MATDYSAIFRSLLDSKENPVTFEKLFDEIVLPQQVSRNTAKKYLRAFLRDHPDYIDKLLGFYPDVETIMIASLRDTLSNEIFMLNVLKAASPTSAHTGINLAIQVASISIALSSF